MTIKERFNGFSKDAIDMLLDCYQFELEEEYGLPIDIIAEIALDC